MRVLAADGDGLFLEILQTYLRRRGIAADIADGASRCVDRLRIDPPNLLILTSEIAWEEGVADVLRGDPVLREIPIILLTDSHDDDRNDADLRVEGRLIKPFRLSDLVSLIRMVESPPLPVELRLELSRHFL